MTMPALTLANLNLPDLNEKLARLEQLTLQDLGGRLSDSVISFKSRTANLVFAAPDGSTGAPTFRALVVDDLPGSIPDTKLATIATAGKVSDSALSSNIPQKDDANTFSGGDQTISAGDLVISGAANGLRAYGRSVREGELQDVPFSAANFTASGGMTWTVAAADVVTNRYARFGTTLIWTFYIDSTDVGGVLSTDLKIAIPGSLTAASRTINKLLVSDNLSRQDGFAATFAGVGILHIAKTAGGNWNAAAGTTGVYGTVTLEVAS